MADILNIADLDKLEPQPWQPTTQSPRATAAVVAGCQDRAYTYYRKNKNGNETAYNIAYKYKPKTQEKELKKRNTAVKNKTVEKLRATFAKCAKADAGTTHEHMGFMRERMSAELEQAIFKVCDAFNARATITASTASTATTATSTLSFELNF